MRSPRSIIDEPRRIRCGRLHLLHVADGLVRHVGRQIVVLLTDPRKSLPVVLEEIRGPLIRFASQETIEIIETHAGRPLVEGSGDAVLEVWRIMVLAEPGRG